MPERNWMLAIQTSHKIGLTVYGCGLYLETIAPMQSCGRFYGSFFWATHRVTLYLSPATLNGLPALTLSLSYLSVFVETTEVVRALHKHTGSFFFQLPFSVRLRHWCHKSGIFLNCFCSFRNPPLHNSAWSLIHGTVLGPD